MQGDVTGLQHFEHETAFDPDAGVEALAEQVPAKWCVYLLADADGRPVQLLCVKNLRASLRRRLGAADEAEGPSRRADLTSIVRRVLWTRVDSAFEQDWVYLEAARDLFPDSYGGVLGFYPAWFVHVNPATTYPRFTRQNQVDKKTGVYVGPLPDKHSADKFVRRVEDLFDLCRDWDRLTSDQSDPCQWRQMGKCVGPCEGPPGGVSLEAYQALVAHAAETLCDVERAIEDGTLRMKHAAVSQAFEAAGAIKGRLAQLEELRTGNFRHVRPIEQFKYLAVLPGGPDTAAKLILVTPGQIRHVATLVEMPTKATLEPILRTVLALADEPLERPMDTPKFERISLATSHLFPNRKPPGEFIPLAEVTDKRVLSAIRSLAKKVEPDAIEDEGEVRGLQAL